MFLFWPLKHPHPQCLFVVVSKDHNDLFKVSMWNDFFLNELGHNLDMVPN